jgi:hypothetical protein
MPGILCGSGVVPGTVFGDGSAPTIRSRSRAHELNQKGSRVANTAVPAKRSGRKNRDQNRSEIIVPSGRTKYEMQPWPPVLAVKSRRSLSDMADK